MAFRTILTTDDTGFWGVIYLTIYNKNTLLRTQCSH